MATLQIKAENFSEQVGQFLQSDKAVAVLQDGKQIGLFVPAPPKVPLNFVPDEREMPAPEELARYRAAADRLAASFTDEEVEELVAEFDRLRRAEHAAARQK